MAEDSKTEKATPKKRRDERKEGNIFQSKDIVTVSSVVVAFLALEALFPYMHERLTDFATRYIGLVASKEAPPNDMMGEIGMDFVITAAAIILPFAFLCMLAGIVSAGVQTRFLFVSKSFYPKFSRLSPLQGIKKLFSLKNLVELLKSILKISILLYVVYGLLAQYLIDISRTMNMDISRSVAFTFEMCMTIIFRVSLVFIAVAFFDYLFQRWEYERSIRMSKQEIKEEYKQTEGNPEIKSKIREMQRQRARMRMMQAVPMADVIIRNPTHFAIALSYNTEKDNAPKVVAKGQDELALRIISVAEEHGVTVVENRPLARALYAQSELNREIPGEHYAAVAEILVYVYRLNNKLR